MPHIALVILGKVIDFNGGAVKVFCDMANALADLDYQVSAICCELKDGVPPFKINSNVSFINAHKPSFKDIFYKGTVKNFICWRPSKNRRIIQRAHFDCAWISESLERTLKELPKVDLYIAFQPESTYILSDRIKVEAPIITMLHNLPYVFTKTPTFSIYRNAVNKSSFVQVLMPEYIDLAKEDIHNAKIIYIPNSVPSFDFIPNYASKKIIVSARIAEAKRPLLLVRAFAIVKEKRPDWICEWWGNTNSDPDLTQQVKSEVLQLGLEHHFLLQGITSDIISKLATASIFVLPSSYEGFSIALAEAMSIGLPAIGCSDCSSINSLIRHETNGLLSTPTPQQLAQTIINLIESKEKRIRLGSQAKVDMSQFSPEKVWNSWKHYIDETLKNTPFK